MTLNISNTNPHEENRVKREKSNIFHVIIVAI